MNIEWYNKMNIEKQFIYVLTFIETFPYKYDKEYIALLGKLLLYNTAFRDRYMKCKNIGVLISPIMQVIYDLKQKYDNNEITNKELELTLTYCQLNYIFDRNGEY